MPFPGLKKKEKKSSKQSETQTITTQNVSELKAKQIKLHSFHDFVSVCLLLEKNIFTENKLSMFCINCLIKVSIRFDFLYVLILFQNTSNQLCFKC